MHQHNPNLAPLIIVRATTCEVDRLAPSPTPFPRTVVSNVVIHIRVMVAPYQEVVVPILLHVLLRVCSTEPLYSSIVVAICSTTPILSISG